MKRSACIGFKIIFFSFKGQVEEFSFELLFFISPDTHYDTFINTFVSLVIFRDTHSCLIVIHFYFYDSLGSFLLLICFIEYVSTYDSEVSFAILHKNIIFLPLQNIITPRNCYFDWLF